MGWILCHVGRHLWHHERNPEVGGREADYEVCLRCGKERPVYGPPAPGSLIGM
ncbi:hypothetical protein HP550_12060 [Cellulomonas humilata]|uniref:Uncharacterized protein n=1 Tax=Cellulomonas humilata TaxID=144055 RepID=A0A7Y6A1E1_9CELL|nr:hypothetical protein [Cellulomonas humilata]NUU17984.1 hypothetical protein [Cellulomonas humilata]